VACGSFSWQPNISSRRAARSKRIVVTNPIHLTHRRWWWLPEGSSSSAGHITGAIFPMKTSHDVSRDAYTLPILLVLEMATEWNVRLRRGGDRSFHFNPVCRRSSPNAEEAIHAAGEQVKLQEAFKMRPRFLAIGGTDGALAFFQEFCPFQLNHSPTCAPTPLRLSHIVKRQNSRKQQAATERNEGESSLPGIGSDDVGRARDIVLDGSVQNYLDVLSVPISGKEFCHCQNGRWVAYKIPGCAGS